MDRPNITGKAEALRLMDHRFAPSAAANDSKRARIEKALKLLCHRDPHNVARG